MAESASFYRKYIQGVVSQANLQKAALERNFVYEQLTKWLRQKDFRLSNEMFKAVLAASRNLTENYLSSGKADIKSACKNCFSFHTFTASDGIHTDEKQIQKYVSEFWSSLKKALDEEKSLGDVALRTRKVDVVQLGKLFDQILVVIPEESQDTVESLMDEFVRSGISHQAINRE